MVALKPEIEPDAANHLSAVQSWIQHALCNNLGLEVADASLAQGPQPMSDESYVILSRVSSPSP